MQVHTAFIIMESSKIATKMPFYEYMEILMKVDNFLQKSKTNVVTPHL